MKEERMEAIVECCAGLDVHQATVVACLNIGPAGKRTTKEIRTYGTTEGPIIAATRSGERAYSQVQLAMGGELLAVEHIRGFVGGVVPGDGHR